MKTVATFLNPEEAKVARSFLVAQGIDAIIAGEESLSVMPHIGMGAKSYQLMVASEDELQAKRLLDSVEQTAATDEPASTASGWSSKRIFLAIAVVVSLFFVFFGNSYSQEGPGDQLSAIDYIACWIRTNF